jgi:iron complex outermembrane receptor protein
LPAVACQASTSILTNEKYEQISQEFRLTSTGDGPFQWIVGGYFQTWDLDQIGTTFLDESNVPVLLGLTLVPGLEGVANLQSFIDYDGDSTTYAGFGQFTWSMSDRARITVGGRYTGVGLWFSAARLHFCEPCAPWLLQYS